MSETTNETANTGADDPVLRQLREQVSDTDRTIIDLMNKRGRHRIIRVDPITGVPEVEQ